MASNEEAVRIAAGVAFNVEPDEKALDLFIAEYDAQRATYAPHPDQNHRFDTTCELCGKAGRLYVALTTDDEVVHIEQVDGK